MRYYLLLPSLLCAGGVWAQSLIQDPQWLQEQLPEVAEAEVVLQLPARPVPSKRISSRLEEFLVEQPTLAQKLLQTAATDPEQAWLEYQEVRSQLGRPEALGLAAQIQLSREQWAAAAGAARDFLERFPEHSSAPSVYWILNRARFEQKEPLDTSPYWLERAMTSLPAPPRLDLWEMLATQARQQDRLLDALEYDLQALQDPGQPDPPAFAESVFERMQELDSTAELNQLADAHPDLALLRQKLPEIYIKLLMRQGEYGRAALLVNQLLPRLQQSNLVEQVEALQFLQRRIQAAQQMQPQRIGVILPITSSSALVSRLTQQTLTGLRLALKVAPEPAPDNASGRPVVSETARGAFPSVLPLEARLPLQEPQWELVIRDSGLNPEQTRRVFAELVEEEHVSAVIGPLTRRTSEAAAEEAQRWQVPLISLSLTSSIAELGDYVFRNNLSWQQEIRDLLRYAWDYQQVRKVAVLYTNEREGREKAKLFLEEAAQVGIEVVAVEQYLSQQASYVHEFEAVTGMLTATSERDEQALAELREKREPHLNFDAVFVAAGSRGLADLKVLLPYISVYELDRLLVLGDSGWSDQALLFAQGRERLRRLVLVDSFFAQSPRPEVQAFVEAHERMMLGAPSYQGPSNYVAYAYDTLLLLKQLLRNPRNHSHRELREALLQLKGFQGATGRIHFDEQGEIQREMQLLTIRNGRFRPIP